MGSQAAAEYQSDAERAQAPPLLLLLAMGCLRMPMGSSSRLRRAAVVRSSSSSLGLPLLLLTAKRRGGLGPAQPPLLTQASRQSTKPAPQLSAFGLRSSKPPHKLNKIKVADLLGSYRFFLDNLQQAVHTGKLRPTTALGYLNALLSYLKDRRAVLERRGVEYDAMLGAIGEVRRGFSNMHLMAVRMPNTESLIAAAVSAAVAAAAAAAGAAAAGGVGGVEGAATAAAGVVDGCGGAVAAAGGGGGA